MSDGAQGQNRTVDTRIFSPLLYRLSYLGAKSRVLNALTPTESSKNRQQRLCLARQWLRVYAILVATNAVVMTLTPYFYPTIGLFMQSFSSVRALIIDMDGVLWHGDHPQAGLSAFFDTLRDLKLPFVLATNNASMTAQQYVDKLAALGISVALKECLTSGMATALYLSQHYTPADTRVFVIGGAGARQPLLDLGFTLTDLYEMTEEQRPHLVVCGLDKALSWDKLATATLAIRAGAQFIGTNGDTTLPTEHGVTHGNGAILAALQAATGVAPTIIGKPEPIIYQQAMQLLGAELATTIAIGDRLDTDILGAVRTGIRSLMVLSGVSTQADIDAVDYAPDWVVQDIRDVTTLLRETAA